MSIAFSRVDEMAVLTLSQPETRNALSFKIIEEIGTALDAVATWPVRALIITGAGDTAFCAGADIKELCSRDLMAQKRGAELGQRVFWKLSRLPIPSLAVINGYAFGGGLELAMACTFRIALESAKMGLPEIKLGLIPGYGGTQRLPRLIGMARAADLIMTGRTIAGAEAERIGLVNRLYQGDAMAAGIAYAREFSCFSLPVLGFAWEAVERSLDLPLVEGLRIEADLSTLAYQTEDAEEGMAAFLAKRKATFHDR